MKMSQEGQPKQSDQKETNKEGMTRRDVLIAGAWAGAAAATVSFSGESNQVRRERELEQVRSLIPEDLPVTADLVDGEIIFSVENDEATTEMINYLAGRGEITEEHLCARLRQRMFEILEAQGQEVSSDEARQNLYNINTRAELEEFFTHYAHTFDEAKWEELGATSSEEFGSRYVKSSLQKEIESRQQIDPRLYRRLWEMYIEVGSPKIVRVDTAAERLDHRNHLSTSSDYFTADEDGSNRVVHLDFSYAGSRMLRQLVQELSHSYTAYKDNDARLQRREYQAKLIGDTSGLAPEEKNQAREIAYLTEGTEEYYAHRVIMPPLMERLVPLYADFAVEWESLKNSQAIKMEEHLQN